MTRRFVPFGLTGMALLAASACEAPQFACETPRVPWNVSIPSADVDEVDLLLVIDDSASMDEEQAALVAELPRLVQALASGDRDGDGVRDFDPVRSLHVGVVTTDLGAGPNDGVATCARGLGDDGILQTRSDATTAPCSAEAPSGVFEFDAMRDDVGDFAAGVGCVARADSEGCVFGQPLEAALKALTPTSASTWTRPGYLPPRFVSSDGIPDSTAGQGDRGNLGFLRADSVLAIVFLSDEEDCSVRDYGLFAADDARFDSVPLGLRCDSFGGPSHGVVTPIDRYVSGLLGLRADPTRLVVSGIVGIPLSTEADADSDNYANVLMDPAMIPRPNAMGTALEPSCSSSHGSASPPVRFVQTLAGLTASGASASISSICAESFAPAVDRVLDDIAHAVTPPCLPRPLDVHADGRVSCELFELLPAAGTGLVTQCASLPGRELVGLVTEYGRTRERCRVVQISREDAATGVGWYYDDAALTPEITEDCGSTPQRIRYAGFDDLLPYANPSFECTSVPRYEIGADSVCDGDEEGGCVVGQRCALGADGSDPCATGHTPVWTGTLACDVVERSCEVRCTRDDECAAAGFYDYVCDRRSNAEAAGAYADEVPAALRDTTRAVCVNPSCGGSD